MTLFERNQLDSQQRLSLLARTNIGRIGLVLGPVPFIYPVRYDVSQGHVIFGVTVDEVAAVIHDTAVGLQADGFDEDEGRHWSVLAVGPATTFDADLEGRPEQAGRHRHAFRLRPRMFSGHWLGDTADPI